MVRNGFRPSTVWACVTKKGDSQSGSFACGCAFEPIQKRAITLPKRHTCDSCAWLTLKDRRMLVAAFSLAPHVPFCWAAEILEQTNINFMIGCLLGCLTRTRDLDNTCQSTTLGSILTGHTKWTTAKQVKPFASGDGHPLIRWLQWAFGDRVPGETSRGASAGSAC